MAQSMELGRAVSTDYLLRILKPTTLKVSRQQPGRATVGDSAEALVQPGMLNLLTSPAAGSTLPLGAGVLPETMIGLSVAGTASYLALGDQERKHRPFYWLGVGLELAWRRPARKGEGLVGRALLKGIRHYTVHMEVEACSAETGEVIMTGEMEFAAVRGGRAMRLTDSLLAFDQPEVGAQQAEQSLRPPRSGTGALLFLRRVVRCLLARSV